MRRTAWIWLAGCIAWTVNGLVSMHLHSRAHAELALIMALLFLAAWVFYRSQRK
jgi:hypothetical protein